MGIVRTQEEENERMEFEDFRQTLVALAALERRKQSEEFKGLSSHNADVDLEEKLVCVTSGASFLGLAIVNRLLLRGYSVRILVDNQEDVEKLREMERSGDMMACKNKISVVMAKPTEIQGLMEAFDGCRGVFHTSAFADPDGISGYSLWYALGKLKAEKVAWKIAEEMGIKLTTICPGLVTGPEFSLRNPTATIAYLKGAQEMYADGLLAIVDVSRLAEAHLSVFEEMNKTAFGRYICFDQVIEREEEAEKLAREMGMPANKICGDSFDIIPTRFDLSNKKLTNLMSRKLRSCYGES
ncbi:cinnamoyl-CoA reductase-like SNL6 isoform X2 [Herrania umbratica]|uniref:Cinnamoyl-CoA reductase-like SNL6 isoform X2 n=1 Tax=Herrania umbratica TaxID=108875 RepID=A0A6J1BJ08_9ROSI|nr:cinnamoyl-CoA reductase-like SNL6 isoform X2 [Herrania umbratica]